MKTKTRTKTFLFHKVSRYGDFIVDGILYKRVTGREGMDEKGNRRRFVESQSVTIP